MFVKNNRLWKGNTAKKKQKKKNKIICQADIDLDMYGNVVQDTDKG